MLFVIGLLFLMVSIAIVEGAAKSILALKYLGLGLTCLLMVKEIDGTSDMADKICQALGLGNCDSVLKSSAAKVFNYLSFSELGAWYFSGGVTSILIGSLSENPTMILQMLLFFTLGGFLFSFYSLYQQRWVIKQWCVLCLGVQLIFWVELVIFLLNGFPKKLNLDWISFFVLSIAFLIPLFFWLLLKPAVQSSVHTKQLQKQLKCWQKDKTVFFNMVKKSAALDTVFLPHPFTVGNPKAEHRIIIVTHFFCKHCAKAHAIVHSIAKWYESICFEFRFALIEEDLRSKAVAKYLYSIYESEGYEKTFVALEDWYRIKDFEKWQLVHGPSIGKDQSDKIINAYKLWYAKTKINYSPAIILNGKLIPPQYDLEKVSYFLPHLSELNNNKDI